MDSQTLLQQLYCKEGTMAFIIPFTFEPIKSTEPDTCSKFFKEIEEECYKDKQLKQEYLNEKALKKLYEGYRKQLVNDLKGNGNPSVKHALFQAASCSSDQWPKKCRYNCETPKYEGRNLCQCFAVSRKFHDDASQDTPRLEVYLGSYPVLYKNGDQDVIRFTIDAMLLLTKEREQNGTSAGFVLFNIHLNLDKNSEDCCCQGTDKFIFVKHLFYKNSLKCIINNDENNPISLQKWTEHYLQNLFSILKIDYSKAINDYVTKEGAFKYSLIELTLQGRETSKIILQDIQENYTQKIYGLLVGDEGWRYFPRSEVKYSHWSSREHSCSFFLDHNALIINVEDEKYNSSAKDWFKNYPELYHSYTDLKPCFPGVSSLTFDAYVKTVYKEMILVKAQERHDSSRESPETKLKQLRKILQMHSLSVDEIRNLEDVISHEMGIELKLEELNKSYTREAGKVQNRKVRFLTWITATISISSLIIAILSITCTNPMEALFPIAIFALTILVIIFIIRLDHITILCKDLINNIHKKQRK